MTSGTLFSIDLKRFAVVLIGDFWCDDMIGFPLPRRRIALIFNTAE
jgi:hypothetical protein